jgi:8-oxo-dGTP pyrophosphatase MutT (NUDIX family)
VLVYIRRRPISTIVEYLLPRRTPARGGFRQGVSGGGVEAGERLAEAARRKVWEETGYQQLGQFMPLNFRYRFPLDRANWAISMPPEVEVIHEECFGAEVSLDAAEPVLDQGEHDAYQWLELSQALALLRWPENQEALRRFAQVL